MSSSGREPDHDEWEAAVREFKERIPELAERAQHLIEAEAMLIKSGAVRSLTPPAPWWEGISLAWKPNSLCAAGEQQRGLGRYEP